jgi:hypothetical protein
LKIKKIEKYFFYSKKVVALPQFSYQCIFYNSNEDCFCKDTIPYNGSVLSGEYSHKPSHYAFLQRTVSFPNGKKELSSKGGNSFLL